MGEKWIDALDPNYINSDLIGDIGSEKVVTIKSHDPKATFYCASKGREETGWALFFDECAPLICNKTNRETLMRLFGGADGEVASCYGHKVILRVEMAKNKRHGIRIHEFSEEKCPICGKVIMPYAGKSVEQVKEISQRNLGEIMCGECMSKKAKEKK